MPDAHDITVNLSQFLTAETMAAIPVVVGLLFKRIRSALGPEKVETLTSLARVAVFAAEELGHKNGKVGEDVSGREKLSYAVGRLTDLAKRVHVKVGDDQAEALIEAVLNEVRPYTEPPVEVPPAPVNAGPVPLYPAFEPAQVDH